MTRAEGHRSPGGWRWLALAATAAFALACRAPERDGDGAPALRVVVWNIHHGRGGDDVVDLARVAAELRALSPDVVLLQEVDVGVRRSGRVDTPAVLGEHLGMHAAFERNIRYQGGDYGNAVLSRYPIASRRNLRYDMLREGEQRGLLIVRVDAPSGPLGIGCTHLDSRRDDAERLHNVPAVLALVEGGELDLVGGDFNDEPGSAVHAALGRATTDCWVEARPGRGDTYPAAAPEKRIDWLLRAQGGPWRAVHAEVAPTAASDHRPVLFVLRRVR